MKDQVTALVETLRLIRLELLCCVDPMCDASPVATVARLIELTEATAVTEAMAILAPDVESPSLVPERSIDLRVPYPWRTH